MSAQRADVYPWLHDDSEEDLVGADWHQDAIRDLVYSLRDLARQRGWPWHVGDQLTLVAWKPDGTPWRPSPDVMVHSQAGPERRAEIDARTEGVPELIVEVASKSTWSYDVDSVRGKALGYLHLGVADYLVFDPFGEYLGVSCRGWQQHDGAIREWSPTDGLYITQRLGIAFRAEDDRLRAIDPDGQPVPYPYENAELARRLRKETMDQERELDQLRAELARLHGLLPPTDDTAG